MSSERREINLDQVRENIAALVQLKAGKREPTILMNSEPALFTSMEQLAEHELKKILELILTKEELEVLELLHENKEVLQFVVKNKDMLKKTKRIRGILRTPEAR